jgi:hypothetical protein
MLIILEYSAVAQGVIRRLVNMTVHAVDKVVLGQSLSPSSTVFPIDYSTNSPPNLLLSLQLAILPTSQHVITNWILSSVSTRYLTEFNIEKVYLKDAFL